MAMEYDTTPLKATTRNRRIHAAGLLLCLVAILLVGGATDGTATLALGIATIGLFANAYGIYRSGATPTDATSTGGIGVSQCIRRMFREREEWEYGTAGDNSRPARRHKKHGNVQFVLWKAGEQGHAEDYWHNFDITWWPTFVPSNDR